ncbi:MULTISPECIES: protein-L-isoaspartate O-methyltransferase [unclassified Herbaspirillum]|jgi:protein-L-isoaspartate(D-aspartate) O-methyltransferase|uniref:protein-L-isoaspartate O-methyltransferase family protein n=1 Tax=unclassified Herbaspirillum TaxID=2624150 RepID=UPI000E2F1391|nr:MULTISPECIES: protein-L-isoaspartate O-methyltransferase [unclassified Herbaspirillum]RFB67103.1 protein-L-isoaspartate O-methyltransferase [Herbaspirillum sp. 3R-3a1]TFI06143.1 protein-L-isoaspartate O-methyltransferase [Herbaspirillum sp. 3R11]TFI14244.1 protein-L-isoaspartate O-methyltransferase [Herbaspirillum sp. 3R-11]TFI22867.1 protein-L-isoaspartate O-methyltransferase [Herbaspirillum sp. 3C11]
MNIEQARFNMIEQQIRPWNVLAQDVLDLLTVVRREEFVPAAHRSLAFFDTEIPLPGGESMLAPKVEARILQEANVKKHEQVLEIGAGSGYMAALLASKARHVTTVEIDPALKAMAEENLSGYGVTNVSVELGNGAQGWQGEYDVIVISGALPFLPDAFLKQIKVGGRVLAIIGEAPVMSLQVITRTSDQVYDTVDVFELMAKPLHAASEHSHFTF